MLRVHGCTGAVFEFSDNSSILIGMKILIAITSLLFAANVSAELYKWIDQNGITHYTDKRPDETVQQQELSGYLARITNRKQPDASDSENPYPAFTITSPGEGETVRNAEAKMDVAIQIDPPLTETHFLQIYLDGLEVGEKTKSTELTLQQLRKGAHRLQARILDEDGQTISTTPEVTFQFREPADLRKIAPNLASPAQ